MFPMLEMLTGEMPRICGRLSEAEYSDLLNNMQGMCNFDMAVMLDGITPAEFALMYHTALKRKQDGCMLTVAQVASLLHVTVPAISRTLKNLEKKSYVTRTVNEKDRRSIHIILSDNGERVLLDNLRRFESNVERILKCFTDEELHSMIKLQTKFVKTAYDVMSQA